MIDETLSMPRKRKRGRSCDVACDVILKIKEREKKERERKRGKKIRNERGRDGRSF